MIRLTSHDPRVQPGDVVQIRGRGRLRLVAARNRSSISFVRLAASWCWSAEYGFQNATVWWSLPLEMRLVRRATEHTRMLAERFTNWSVKPITERHWQAVCDLSLPTIVCDARCA